MLFLFKGRSARGQRPSGPSQLNRASPQAQGLLGAYFLGPAFGNVAGPRDQPTPLGSVPQDASTLGGLVPVFAGAQNLSVARPMITAAPFTMSCWFTTALTATGPYPLITVQRATNVDMFRLSLYQNKIIGQAQAATAGGFAQTTATYAASTWQLATYVERSTTDRSVYLNGINRANNATSTAPTTLTQTVFGETISPNEFFTGSMAHACLWNRALTDDQIWALYDPATRWDLLWVPGRRVFFNLAASGGTVARARYMPLTGVA